MKNVSLATLTATLLMLVIMTSSPLVVHGQNAVTERRPCLDASSGIVQQSRQRTTDDSCASLSCPGGCCRYHTAFLTCDESNSFPHQQCVCNENTAPRPNDDRESPQSTPGNTIPGNPSGIANPVTPAPVTPSTPTPAPVVTPAPVAASADEDSSSGDPPTTTSTPAPASTDSTSAPTGPVVNAGRCANGSVWQTMGFPFTNCASGAGCEGVTEPKDPTRPTCCKKSFCWCGVYDVEDMECVA
jgi:hypothetical protein